MKPRLLKLLTTGVVVTACAAGPVAFAHVAAHDAVGTIEGRYEPLLPQPRDNAHAAPEIAAAAAPYLVLRHDFPASAGNLTRDYDACCSTRTVCATRSPDAGRTSWRAPAPSRCSGQPQRTHLTVPGTSTR